MPFLGKQPTAGFASIVKDDLTPDGSTTAFTLSKQVASANDIAVVVGNVRQEPTDAYSVSGTTLTMTAAPASGVNFYVLHIAGTVESSVVPAAGTSVPGAFDVAGALTTDGLTSDGNVSVVGQVGVNTSGNTVTGRFGTGVTVRRAVPEVHLKRDDNQGEGGILLDNNSSTQRLFVGTYNTNQETHIGTNGTQRLVIDSSGRIAMPYQPYFYAKNTGAGSENGDGFTTTPIIFPTSTKDVGGNLSNTGSRFTAPVNGLYFFTGVPGYKQTGSDFAIRFAVNGTQITDVVRLIGSGITSHAGLSFGANIYLNANDYVELVSVGGAYHRNNASVPNWWSGGLLWAT